MEWSENDFKSAHAVLDSILTRSGSLMKKGEKNAQWKRRFFTLGQETETGKFPRVKFFYFEKDTDKRHINFIILGSNTKVRADPLTPKNAAPNTGFRVESEGGRVYHLAADSEDEQIQWVLSLRKICLVLAQREQQNHQVVITDGLLQDDVAEWTKSVDYGAPPSVSSKAARLLAAPESSGKRLSYRKSVSLKSSIDLIVERGSDLENLWEGKRLSVRVACVNAATSVFTWWEFFGSGESEVRGGCAEWHADYSFENSGVGCELVLRLMAGDVIIGEARFEADGSKGKNTTEILAAKLHVPIWSSDETARKGGSLRDDDVFRQGGKRPKDEIRGTLHLRIAQCSDASEAMLCRLGLLAEPCPVRLNTGDVLLFNQTTGAARITKIFTWSKWSHAAMIVRRRNGFLSVLEATGDGVNMYDLDAVWWRYHKVADIAIVRLMVPNGLGEEDHEKIYTFVETLKGRPYEKSLLTLVGKVSRTRTRSASVGEFQGTATSKADSEITQVFCSELIAYAYRAVGLIASTATHLELLPKHFDVTESSEVQLQRGAKLFPPRVFERNPDANY